jgi:hypothetical protein
MTSRRGGLLLGGAFVTFAVSAALMHSYAVFLVAFLEEFRWSRAETSLAYSVSAFVSGASAPFVGSALGGSSCWAGAFWPSGSSAAPTSRRSGSSSCSTASS